jgi:hypothetical protein
VASGVFDQRIDRPLDPQRSGVGSFEPVALEGQQAGGGAGPDAAGSVLDHGEEVALPCGRPEGAPPGAVAAAMEEAVARGCQVERPVTGDEQPAHTGAGEIRRRHRDDPPAFDPGETAARSQQDASLRVETDRVDPLVETGAAAEPAQRAVG